LTLFSVEYLTWSSVTTITPHTLDRDAGLVANVSAAEMSLLYVGFTTSSRPRFTPYTITSIGCL